MLKSSGEVGDDR